MGRYSLKYGTIGSLIEREPGEPRCYTDDWKRSSPDYVVYLPQEFIGRDTDNVHFLVTVTPRGNLLGFWTQGTYEAADNERVVSARSTDGGETWSMPIEIDGPDERYQVATYASPIVSDSGRLYVFYGKMLNPKLFDLWTATALRCRVSDDDGHTWSDPVEFGIPRTPSDSDDPSIPPQFVIWQKPVRDSKGRWIVSYSHVTHLSKRPDNPAGPMLIRFDNINDGPDLKDLELTFLPTNREPIRPMSWEASLALLPDGRLFATMTTTTGSLWCSVSEDDGGTWREPEPLRYQDGGERVLHPGSPGPLFTLEDGRYLLQYHNNDGSASSGPQPMWARPYGFSRRSMFIAVGEYRPDTRQPIWFSTGKRIADTDGVPAGVQNRLDCGTYGSLTEHQDRRVLWYPDRKHFLLGKLIPDELLADMKVAEA